MKVGIALNMLCQAGRSDASVVGEHLALGDLAEPLGFDSIFALEHHFTGYAMSPAPTQLLAYYAGRTKRVQLGTAVIVLPWHDPVRVAEQIALLDLLCGGRCLFGFGRGAASVEYEGFRIPMEEARPRFVEAAQDRRSGAEQRELLLRRRVLQDPAHRDPPPADLAPGAALLRLGGQPGLGRDHGQARLRAVDGHAERMGQGVGGHHPLSRDRDRGRAHAAPADHPDQCLLCRKPRRGARARVQISRPEMAVDRRPLPFLGRASRHRQRLRELRQDGAHLRQDRRKRRNPAKRPPISTSASRSPARLPTASKRSPSCSG